MTDYEKLKACLTEIGIPFETNLVPFTDGKEITIIKDEIYYSNYRMAFEFAKDGEYINKYIYRIS